MKAFESTCQWLNAAFLPDRYKAIMNIPYQKTTMIHARGDEELKHPIKAMCWKYLSQITIFSTVAVRRSHFVSSRDLAQLRAK